MSNFYISACCEEQADIIDCTYEIGVCSKCGKECALKVVIDK